MIGKTIEQQLDDAKYEIKELNEMMQYHKERAARLNGTIEAYEKVLRAAGLIKEKDANNE